MAEEPGREGGLCEDATLLGSLAAPALRGAAENARSKKLAEKNNIFMDAKTTCFDLFDTRLIVRKGCVDSSKIRSWEPLVAQASRPCESRNRHTGQTPVPLPPM